MGFATLRMVFLFFCCVQCLFWSHSLVNGLSLYKMYPYEEQQALESLQDSMEGLEDDESQIVKRKPNNNRFFLKGLRGKRSPAYPARQSMEQVHPQPCNIYKLISCY